MTRNIAIAAAVAALFLTPAIAGDSSHSTRDARAIIALLDGQSPIAAVSSDLQEALADARIAAFAQGRLLSIPSTLAYQPAGHAAGAAIRGYVTLR